jgi:serine/threonine-protein phosphatase 2A regulatory subunit B'
LEKKDSNKSLALIQDPKNLKKDRTKLDEKWKALLKLAQAKNPNLKDPVLPYVDIHIVGEHNGINNGNVNIL